VSVSVPADVGDTTQSFRLRVYQEDEADVSAESDPIVLITTAKVAEPEPGKFPPNSESERRPKRLPIGLIGGSAALLGVISVVIFLPLPRGVPDVVGLSQDDAEASLHSHGLTTGQVDERFSDKDRGTVVEQDPPAKARRPGDLKVNLVIASSDDLSGQTAESAPKTPGTVQFLRDRYRVQEDENDIDIVVIRSSGSDGPASVTYAVQGVSAKEGTDFAPTTGTLSWEDGEAGLKAFVVSVLDDDREEGPEEVYLYLQSPVGATLGDPDSAELTIVDNDETPASKGTVQFATSTPRTINEDAGSIEILVTRTGGTDGTASVSVGGSGAATPKSDYVLSADLLTWPPGDATAQPLSVFFTNDSSQEPNETLHLSLTNPSGATLGNPSTLDITILTMTMAPPRSTPRALSMRKRPYNSISKTWSKTAVSGGLPGWIHTTFTTGGAWSRLSQHSRWWPVTERTDSENAVTPRDTTCSILIYWGATFCLFFSSARHSTVSKRAPATTTVWPGLGSQSRLMHWLYRFAPSKTLAS
jgi:hypothetical protein